MCKILEKFDLSTIILGVFLFLVFAFVVWGYGWFELMKEYSLSHGMNTLGR